jgi:D-lactate dehydrogenase
MAVMARPDHRNGRNVRISFDLANKDPGHDLTFIPAQLTTQTVELAKGFPVVSTLTNDTIDAAMLNTLKADGTELIALR